MRLFCAFLLLAVVPAAAAVPATTLDVYFIDVGDGDAILIEQGSTEWLIDTGYKTKWPQIGECTSLFGIPVKKPVEHFILTHPDLDHYSALDLVLCPCRVQSFSSSASRASSIRSQDELRAARQQGCEGQATTPLSPGADATGVLGGDGLEWIVLHPDVGDAATPASDNDKSLVLLLSLGDVHFLFTGDLETAPSSISNWSVPSGVVILKAPHHGSSHSALSALMDHFRPSLVIFSTEDNIPALADSVMTRGISFLSTSTSGSIHVHTDGKTVWITTTRLSGEASSWDLGTQY